MIKRNRTALNAMLRFIAMHLTPAAPTYGIAEDASGDYCIGFGETQWKGWLVTIEGQIAKITDPEDSITGIRLACAGINPAETRTIEKSICILVGFEYYDEAQNAPVTDDALRAAMKGVTLPETSFEVDAALYRLSIDPRLEPQEMLLLRMLLVYRTMVRKETDRAFVFMADAMKVAAGVAYKLREALKDMREGDGPSKRLVREALNLLRGPEANAVTFDELLPVQQAQARSMFIGDDASLRLYLYEVQADGNISARKFIKRSVAQGAAE